MLPSAPLYPGAVSYKQHGQRRQRARVEGGQGRAARRATVLHGRGPTVGRSAVQHALGEHLLRRALCAPAHHRRAALVRRRWRGRRRGRWRGRWAGGCVVGAWVGRTVGAHTEQDWWMHTEAGGRAGRLWGRVEVEAQCLVARATCTGDTYARPSMHAHQCPSMDAPAHARQFPCPPTHHPYRPCMRRGLGLGLGLGLWIGLALGLGAHLAFVAAGRGRAG